MTAAAEESVALDQLPVRAPGYAYVESVAVTESETIVRLHYATGESVSVAVPVLPAPEKSGLAPGLEQVLSVQIRTISDLECVAVGTSGGGPQRVPIDLGQAMALAAEGVHTVFMTRPVARRQR